MAEKGVRSTPAKRSAQTMIECGMGSLLFLAIAVGLFLNDHIVWAVIVFLLTLVLTYAAFSGSFTAACPNCGEMVMELQEGYAERCPRCFHYSGLGHRQFRELDPADSYYGPFTIPLPPNFAIPQFCCTCGTSATRNKPYSQMVNLAINARLPSPSKLKSYSLELPYCDRHDAGVIFRAEATSNSIGLRRIGVFDPKPTTFNPGLFTVMEVRSHRFYWEFIRLNGMDRL